MKFKGCYSALVTPFNKELKIDYSKLEQLIEIQIENNIDGIVSIGTTGESPTLSIKEQDELVKFTVKTVASRTKVIVGSGANDTQKAITLTKQAEYNGADASLQVSPYYNKPTQEGIFEHFNTIANNTKLPLMLYNIPGRCSINIELDTLLRLSEKDNIVAIKEASGCLNNVTQIIKNSPLQVLGGDDALILPMLSVGSVGLVSVLSNILPKQMKDIIDLYLNNDIYKSKKLFFKLYDLMNSMFIESNPIPIKTLLSQKGLIDEYFRLPLCKMKQKNKDILSSILNNYETR